jgi:hypothetical protein
MKNRELIQMLKLEKSLVYFSTSLTGNEMVLEKMLKIEDVKKFPEDTDLLEDVIVENKQAIEMCNIYRDILSGTMDAFASIISNNLNIVMKLLASLTIVLSIPSIVSGFFGMNTVINRGETRPGASPLWSASRWGWRASSPSYSGAGRCSNPNVRHCGGAGNSRPAPRGCFTGAQLGRQSDARRFALEAMV